jgi:hypothetical protein
MKKAPTVKNSDDLRHEYDLSQLRGGVRGKYHRKATAGMNLVLLDPDLAVLFPDSEAVNRALGVHGNLVRPPVSTRSVDP